MPRANASVSNSAGVDQCQSRCMKPSRPGGGLVPHGIEVPRQTERGSSIAPRANASVSNSAGVDQCQSRCMKPSRPGGGLVPHGIEVPRQTERGSSIASLIGHSGSSAFRPTTTTAVSMSLTGSCFSSESAPGPSIMGVEDEAEQSTERPCCNERQVQAIGRTHLIHRPARDIIPPQGGARVSSYRM